ncbi:MAG: hypothetical protein WCD89_27010 [Anaerocolumna sp.]
MIRLKKTTSLLAGIVIIFSLTACAPEDPNAVMVKPTQESGQTAAPTDTEHNTVDNSSIEALLSGTPAHISKVFREDFAVEADVHVSKVKKADILFAKSMPFDEQKLLSVFYKGKTPQRSLTSYDDTIMYKDDNSNLNFNDGFLGYGTQDYASVQFPTDSFSSASDIFTANRRFSEVYTQENLGFMTRSEALETVSDVLTELSLDVMDDAEIYAIDSITMQTQQDEEIQRLIDRQKEAGISPTQDPTYGYQTKDAFTPEDDFYILFFKMVQNKIPVTQKSYTIQASNRALNGSTARVAFSRNGIIQLNFNGIYQQQGIAESPSTLISVEEALREAYEEHNSIISTDKVTVTAVDFEYVPVPYNSNYDEVKLTPAWCLTLAYERDKTSNKPSNKPSKDGKQDSQSSVSNRMIFINAVTGEEI